MIRKLIFVLFSTFLVTSCTEKGNGILSPYAQKLLAKNPEQSVVPTKRNDAKDLLLLRKESESKTYAMLEADLWKIIYVYQGGEPGHPEDLFGNWIDFHNDWTYEYGIYDQIIEKGEYHLNWEKQELLLLSQNENSRPSLWSMRSKNDMIIIEGKSFFGDNQLSMHFVRIQEIPKKEG